MIFPRHETTNSAEHLDICITISQREKTNFIFPRRLQKDFVKKKRLDLYVKRELL
eukprot:UN02613